MQITRACPLTTNEGLRHAFFGEYLTYTQWTEPPFLYRKWACVSLIASALERRVCYHMGREVYYGNFYIVIVGPPAARKGTAMRSIRELANRVGIGYAPSEATRQSLISILKGGSDMSVEDRATQMAAPAFHASLNVHAPELTVFITQTDGKLISYLCDWYDCPGTFTYGTVERGLEELNNVWVNMFGATTPTLLQTSLPQETVGAGLGSRIIFVMEEEKGQKIYRPGMPNEFLAPGMESLRKEHDKGVNRMEDNLVHDLEQMRGISGSFIEGPGFQDAYNTFRDRCEAWDPKTPKLAGYADRRPIHGVKLAMIFSVSRNNEKILLPEDLEDAEKMLIQTEVKMPRVFLGVGANPLGAIQEDIKMILKARGRVSIEELMERYQGDCTYWELERAITVVVKMGMANHTQDQWLIHREQKPRSYNKKTNSKDPNLVEETKDGQGIRIESAKRIAKKREGKTGGYNGIGATGPID